MAEKNHVAIGIADAGLSPGHVLRILKRLRHDVLFIQLIEKCLQVGRVHVQLNRVSRLPRRPLISHKHQGAAFAFQTGPADWRLPICVDSRKTE